jgi:hypothetical protein
VSDMGRIRFFWTGGNTLYLVCPGEVRVVASNNTTFGLVRGKTSRNLLVT